MMMSEFQLWWFCSSNLVLIVYSYSLPKVPNHYIDKNLVHFFFSLHPPFPASFVCFWKSHHFIPSWHHQTWVCYIKMPCKPYFSGTSALCAHSRCGVWPESAMWIYFMISHMQLDLSSCESKLPVCGSTLSASQSHHATSTTCFCEQTELRKIRLFC